jgi:hypothetical protein
MILTAMVFSLAVLTDQVHAQPESNDGSWVIWPSGAVAFPTGRFGEKDEDASAPKDGNKTGFGGGLDAGYFISDFACIGVNYSMNRFDLDVAETPLKHGGDSSCVAATNIGSRMSFSEWASVSPKGKRSLILRHSSVRLLTLR